MIFHDWIPVPPFNDVIALKKEDGNWGRLFSSFVNGTFVIIPLYLTISYMDDISIVAWKIFIFYFILTIGTILSWWVPYIFGSPESHKKHFRKFDNTHNFLPKRGTNIIPNTLHIILHIQIWVCMIISLSYAI